jgi:hypothetical protein
MVKSKFNSDIPFRIYIFLILEETRVLCGIPRCDGFLYVASPTAPPTHPTLCWELLYDLCMLNKKIGFKAHQAQLMGPINSTFLKLSFNICFDAP